MLQTLFRLAARLPLSWLHALGAVIGWIAYAFSPSYAARLRENIRGSKVCEAADCDQLIRGAVAEAGKGVAEIIALWFAADDRICGWMHCDTWLVAEQARARGRGIVFMTPHLGGFEICAQYIAQRMPITVMYRPPKLTWLEPLMIAGRSRWGAAVVPANLKGVRAFFRALKSGQAVGLLPDQTPGVGEGAWADFFGRPAYTMTLVTRLQASAGVPVIMVSAQRLASGRGYQIRFENVAVENFSETRLNRAVEDVVRRCPEQYLWGYNRYKTPAGAPPPQTAQPS
ncbi:MAG: lysophospholipid acyltransferase family protein [Burkholderiales bacterium]